MSVLNFCFESHKVQMSMLWRKEYDMPSSIPHQKFCFYHLPTRGRAGIKLGDAWYISNVSIIFYCSMLLYYPSRMFYMHLYAILYDFEGITFFGHVILKDIIALLVCLKYYYFYVNIKLLFWILWIWIFLPQ